MNDNYSTSAMHYDVLGIPEGKTIYDFYPELLEYPELHQPISVKEKDKLKEKVILEAEKAFIFCALMADPKSPFKDIRDFKVKASRAAVYAKFPTTESGYSDEIRDILDLKNYRIQLMMLRYFMNTAEYEFEHWMSLKSTYHQTTMLLRRSTSTNIDDAIAEVEKKNKIQGQLEQLKIKILELEASIFDDDKIKEALQKATTAKSYRWAEEFSDPNPDEEDVKRMEEDSSDDEFEQDWAK